jgi:transcriptional regulator with GAF, ATPase, and Fis domain
MNGFSRKILGGGDAQKKKKKLDWHKIDEPSTQEVLLNRLLRMYWDGVYREVKHIVRSLSEMQKLGFSETEQRREAEHKQEQVEKREAELEREAEQKEEPEKETETKGKKETAEKALYCGAFMDQVCITANYAEKTYNRKSSPTRKGPDCIRTVDSG